MSDANRLAKLPSSEIADQVVTVFEQYDFGADWFVTRYTHGIVLPEDYFPTVNATGVYGAYRYGYLLPGEAVRTKEAISARWLGLIVANRYDMDLGAVEMRDHIINRRRLGRQGVEVMPPDSLQVYEIPDPDLGQPRPRRLSPNMELL